MPAISKIEKNPEFVKASLCFEKEDDKNVCVPIAIALLTGENPKKVNEICIEKGREKGNGTNLKIAREVFKTLGFSLTEVPLQDFIDKYPGIHKTALKGITSHHPRRFPLAFFEENLYMVGKSHALAVKNGEVLDWSVNRTIRMNFVYRVKPLKGFSPPSPLPPEKKEKKVKAPKVETAEEAPKKKKPSRAKKDLTQEITNEIFLEINAQDLD